jgi:hypothetical protein
MLEMLAKNDSTSRLCLASGLVDVSALRQSVQKVDAANHKKGPHQHLLEIKSDHYQYHGHTS